jgi:protein-tyrosine phosphatase
MVAVWVGVREVKTPTPSTRCACSGEALSAKNALRMEHPPSDLVTHTGDQRSRLRCRTGMDITWVTERIGVGGGIWNADNMAKVAEAGVTHIIDMQIEFDDTPLAAEYGIEVLWNPTDDDFEFKPAELFRRGVGFAKSALDSEGTKLFVHCAAGVHRAPMMTLAILGSMGWKVSEAQRLIESRRPAADFAEVYVGSVEEFLWEYDG